MCWTNAQISVAAYRLHCKQTLSLSILYSVLYDKGLCRSVITFRLPSVIYCSKNPQRGQNYKVRRLVKKNKAAVYTLYSVIAGTIWTPPTQSFIVNYMWYISFSRVKTVIEREDEKGWKEGCLDSGTGIAGLEFSSTRRNLIPSSTVASSASKCGWHPTAWPWRFSLIVVYKSGTF